MSLTTLGEVPRTVFRFSRVAVAVTSDHHSIVHFQFLARKKVDQTEPSFRSTATFVTGRLINEPEIIATAPLERQETDLGTSPRV